MTKNITARRRAIYTGMYPYLDTDSLMQALLIWEQKYADDPAFAVQHFINEVCTVNDLKNLRRDILLSLVKTLALPEDELLPDPSSQIEYYQKLHNITVAVEYTSRELQLFQKLVIALLEQIRLEVRVSIKDYVLDQLPRLRVDPAFKRQLQLWLSKQVPTMRVSSPDLESIRKIINLFYVGLCEYLGPVEADKLLGRCVARITDNYTNDATETIRKLL